MGQQKGDRQMFNYAVNLEKRVRSNHPLRKVAVPIDFDFVTFRSVFRTNGCY